MTRFALITGGSRGLGAHLVRRFWLDGYSLGIVARHHSDIESVLDQLPFRHNQFAIPLLCDLADIEKITSLINHIKIVIPQLDVLVNNAAIQGPIGPLCLNDISAWQQTLQVNLFAQVVLCQGLIPLMKRPGGASIINLSGGGATGPRVNFSAYATAKAGLVRFSETIAEELKAEGIRVNCIAPGPMKTSMLDDVIASGDAAGHKELLLAHEVIKEGGSSFDRVADLALFLAGDASLGVTGKLISAVWDNWEDWLGHLDDLTQSDVYTLRRITGRDRGFDWGDK
jgi:NAD(P)-dependent dehydrogenase (short-subunit alcohol dehydrogenase family)